MNIRLEFIFENKKSTCEQDNIRIAHANKKSPYEMFGDNQYHVFEL